MGGLLNHMGRKHKIIRVYKIFLVCKNMDDMMHDAMLMHKGKQQTNLLEVFWWAVT
jgi:hypothetical protein